TGLEIGVVAFQTLGGGGRDRLDLPLELRVDPEPDAEGFRDELDRPVVVGRAEPARDEDGVCRERVAERRLELGRSVPDDCDPCRLEPEPQRFARQERAVEIGAVAAHELAPRDDDDDAGPAQPPARTVFVGVTTTFRFRRAGSETGLPPSLNRTPVGRRTYSQKRLPITNSESPGRRGPWKTMCPAADRRRTSRY